MIGLRVLSFWYVAVPGAQQPERLLVVGAPHQIAIFHQITNLQFMYLLYDLPIQKVLRQPVDITYIFRYKKMHIL
ncbi:hypothetical protein ACN38_g10791 [Penicillium nordicum]|uniref:Uncharacterized protein n=1 Tax=Penicillium nordicum TaxID=229535 RepID=A0A0M9WBB1_9EURO|nr:hypothetical protein ACN38_g10791 [Penicillium nordicum]